MSASPPVFGRRIVGLLFVSSIAAAQEAKREELPTTTITGNDIEAFQLAEIDAIQEELETIPGGTSLVTEEQYRFGRAANLSDILQFSPSVYNQSRFGGSETRLSVRGSGIRQTFNIIGVKILRDGLPISEADGNSRPQLIDPLTIQSAAVYPGANGLIWGSSFLGGAINFTTPTGYTSEPWRVRVATGSDDYTRMQVTTGGVLDNGNDYYLSGSLLETDNFRDHSQERLGTLYGNYGFAMGDDWTGRVYATSIDSGLQLPGSIMKSQANDNPRQANGFWAGRGSRRDFDVARVDFRAEREYTDGELILGASYQYLDMYHPLPFGGDGGGINKQIRDDYTLSARYRTMADWFGAENELVVGAFAALGDDDSDRFDRDAPGDLNRARERESTTLDIFAEDRIRLSDEFRLVVGGLVSLATREQDTESFPADPGDGTQDEDYSGFSPKIGFLWDTSDTTQWFGSVAGSFEAPTDGAIENAVGVVDEQTAWTLELGGRGQSDHTTWQGAVFYSQVSDEILTTTDGMGMPITGNIDDTIHYGVELAAQHAFPLGNVEDATGQSDRILLRGIYTMTKLEFDGDQDWGDNDIPGVPEHQIRLELLYDQPNGFYGGLRAEIVSDWYVDFANSFEADSFEVFSAVAGYRANKWRWFAEARNLANEEYVSNTGITENLGGADGNFFNPGQTFALITGIEFTP